MCTRTRRRFPSSAAENKNKKYGDKSYLPENCLQILGNDGISIHFRPSFAGNSSHFFPSPGGSSSFSTLQINAYECNGDENEAFRGNVAGDRRVALKAALNFWEVALFPPISSFASQLSVEADFEAVISNRVLGLARDRGAHIDSLGLKGFKPSKE